MWQRLAVLGLLAVNALTTGTFASPAAYNVTGDEAGRRLQRGELPGPDKTQMAAVNFDVFVLSAYYWPGHCANSKGIAACTTMPAQWKSGLVVHGLWPSYSDAYKKTNKLAANAQGPDGGAMKCLGKAYDKTKIPATAADQLVFPGTGVSNKSPDFYQYQWNKHGICAQMEQKAYFTTAVTLGKAASAKLPAVPTAGTIKAADLQKSLGSLAQPTCFRDAKGRTILWFVNFCYKRTTDIGGQTACPGVSNCSGTITLKV
ncbi:hypothetical protein Poli38472_007212 [Pythium oligandrum]|uniref:Uncharacterized protein n=1 Tax=Pythium oligandrum TaxID=41045 RepID=A0A8K1CAW4_PYTOL|nr:hypothetical protein Poli38472_007212 [Pythium oligandrum]|eukprot:TMW59067.1 hypothetical protein Poli38472_007212 [Pythium oligandrum]